MTLFFIRFNTVDTSRTQLPSTPDIITVLPASTRQVSDLEEDTASSAMPEENESSAVAVPTLMLGLIAASSYSIANLALRALSKTDGGAGWDMWVAGAKAFPTLAVAVLLLLALAIVSGLCYGVTGVFIRKAVRSQMPVEATLFLFSAAGFLVLCPLSLLLMPFQVITDTSSAEWATIGVAGIFNALGFFAITHAMRSSR